jgi:hypothetical protein
MRAGTARNAKGPVLPAPTPRELESSNNSETTWQGRNIKVKAHAEFSFACFV